MRGDGGDGDGDGGDGGGEAIMLGATWAALKGFLVRAAARIVVAATAMPSSSYMSQCVEMYRAAAAETELEFRCVDDLHFALRVHFNLISRLRLLLVRLFLGVVPCEESVSQYKPA